jgi:NAD(P)-dependent dehydrogenase (short-subunit alcohol dehydrogenase family)
MTTQAPRQVVLVTGGGAGIGRATATAFADTGAMVVVADIDPARGGRIARELGGSRSRFVAVDVSDAPAVNAMITEIVQTEGRLDVVHNNAGVASRSIPLHEVGAEEWDRVMGVNLRGAWNVMAAAIRAMRQQGHGAIVNTASIGSFAALSGRAPYCAAKAGLIALTKVAALENGPFGIRVNAIAPGMIATDMAVGALGGSQPTGPPPAGRVGEPEEVAAAVVWLSSAAASYVNGTCLTIDGGWTIGVPPRSSAERGDA